MLFEYSGYLKREANKKSVKLTLNFNIYIYINVHRHRYIIVNILKAIHFHLNKRLYSGDCDCI